MSNGFLNFFHDNILFIGDKIHHRLASAGTNLQLSTQILETVNEYIQFVDWFSTVDLYH